VKTVIGKVVRHFLASVSVQK